MGSPFDSKHNYSEFQDLNFFFENSRANNSNETYFLKFADVIFFPCKPLKQVEYYVAIKDYLADMQANSTC